MIRIAIALAGFAAYFLSPLALSADEVRTLTYQRGDTGPTIEQNYILLHDTDPELIIPNPIATLVLFIGGNGRMNIADRQLGINANNFLLRSRSHLASLGPFNIAVMDAASDFSDANGLFGKRTSPEHLEDMKRVIYDLRVNFRLPVCVVGTSRGSISAAHVAASFTPPDGPDCVVLTSSVTVDRPNRNSLNDVALENIRVPTLVMSHKKDQCEVSPPRDALATFQRLANARRRDLAFQIGGFKSITEECSALTAHGFFGVEPAAAIRISDWIRKALIVTN
jgi:hypothetical protein